MEIVAVIDTNLKDNIITAARKFRIPLEPMFPGTDDPTLIKYYRVWVEDSEKVEEVSTWVLQALLSIPGVDAAYSRPTPPAGGWRVQDP